MIIIICLALTTIGFYFGRYLGAITLPMLFFYFFYAKKSQKPTPFLRKASDTMWAYRVLGIVENADLETIKKARKKCLNRYHPDKLPQNASEHDKRLAAEKINDINRAFEVLRNDEK